LNLRGEANMLCVGLSNTGKTTTLLRLVGEALRRDWSAIVIDLKGSGMMQQTVARLAAKEGAEYFPFDRSAGAASFHYNPCAGTAGEVSSRLVGAFSFT